MITGFIITIAGLALIITRGPLVLAPAAWRDKLVQSLLATPAKMRTLGLAEALVAAICYWLTMNDPSIAGQAVRWVSAFVFVVAIFWAIFSGPSHRLAVRVWNGFSPTVLRVLGIGAVLVGGWLVFVGGTYVGAALANM